MSKFLSLCLVAIVAVTASAQVANGSFEISVAGGTAPGAGWTATGTTPIRVFPYLTCTSEAVGFPSQGSKYARIVAGPNGTTTSFATANNLFQSFSVGTTPVLKLDFAFSTAEGVGNTTYNDFGAVTVSVGATQQTVLLLDTATAAYPSTACNPANPMTAKTQVNVNLFSLFPGSNGTTVFTLKIWCVNGTDTAVPSYAFVDNVTLNPPATPNLDATVINNGGGMYTFQVTGPGVPNAEVYNLFTPMLSVPTGSGPVFGINLDAGIISQIETPIGTQPFHVLLNGAGSYSLGPFALGGGIMLDYISVAIVGGSVAQWSPAHTITFP